MLLSWVSDAWDGGEGWSGWAAVQSVEFSGAVVGAALSVGLGLLVAWLGERRRGKRRQAHVRRMVAREIQANRNRTAGMWAAMLTDDKKRDIRAFTRMGEPIFVDATEPYLLQEPEALTDAEAEDLQAFRAYMMTIVGAWQILRSALLFDLTSGQTTMTTDPYSGSMQYTSPFPPREFDRVQEQIWPELSAAVGTIVNHPPIWAVKPDLSSVAASPSAR